MQDGDCPHLLFYGPSGAGKKTLVLALLREIFGAGVERVKVESKDWKLEVGSRNVEVELVMLSSNYHVEMNPSDVGNKDKYVVQEVIKEMARGRLLGVEGGKGYKVLVLNEVDKLSREAQHALRRTMEQYSATCRLILICNNISKVLDALRSRTIPVRVPAPSELEVVDLLVAVAEKEAVQLPMEFAAKVAHASDRNMRRALLSLEACKVAQYPFRPDQVIQNTDWELYIAQIAREIMSDQSPKTLFVVRGRLYELLINAISPELILKKLAGELQAKMDAQLKYEVAAYAAFFEHRLQLGQKCVFFFLRGVCADLC